VLPITDYNPLAIAITKTWANVNFLDSVYNIDGYHLFRKDRFDRPEGGVCLYVSNVVNSDIDNTLTHEMEYKESIWCNIIFPNKIKLLVGVIYHPSNFAKTKY